MKTIRLISELVGIVVLAALFGTACAESFPEKTGYLIDSRGHVTRNAYGECWRTGYWTPAMAIAECDPDLVVTQTPTSAGPISPAPVPAPAPPASPVAPSAPSPPKAVEKPALAQAAPEKPVVQAYFNAETLFDFDRAVVKPEGRKILDEKIVAGMKQHLEVTMLVITGHADRIGTEEYNQSLSERRANAVKAYLVKQGIPAERMRAYGKGESEPNPAANTSKKCLGMGRADLIRCLQPDRRVTVESQNSTAGK